jgi:large subunit ribosomal protein L13
MHTRSTKFITFGDVEHKWIHIDAEGCVLGRLAVIVADLLRGKNQANFSPNADTGHFIIITNARKVHITGAQGFEEKMFWHTGYPGGIKSISKKQALEGKKYQMVLKRAIKGMLPKGPLGYAIIKKLFIYADDQHPHIAQKPQTLNIEQLSIKNKNNSNV